MRDNILLKSASLVGFVTVGVGILTAYWNPATGYELSPYAATPLLFWVCSCVALLVAVAIVFSRSGRQMKVLGGFLGGLSMTSIVSLPLIRGYHYFGPTDSLSHLGTTRDLHAGQLSMTENIYPVVHTVGSVLHDATGLQLEHVLLILVIVFVVLFFLFIPLVTRSLTGNQWFGYLGLFAGLLLLPINNMSPSIYIHPTSQALMYIPAFLFIFLALYRRRRVRNSLLFLLVAPVFVLLHPQQAANLLFFLSTIAVVQIGYDLYHGYSLTRWRSWVLPEIVAYVAFFWFWVRNVPSFWQSIETIYMIPFRDVQVAESTATRQLSLSQVGGSIPEVFLKLFFVSVVFLVLTTYLLFHIISRMPGDTFSRRTDDTVTPDGGRVRLDLLYVFAGLSTIALIFLVYLIGSISDQYFRQLGAVMVFATILGSIALGRLQYKLRSIGPPPSERTTRLTVAAVIIICLALSIPVFFASPYIYDSSDHVTKTQMEGYETTFSNQADQIAFADVRSSTNRYGNAILGREIPSSDYYQRDKPGVPDHFSDRALPAYFNETTYVPVTEADRTRDAELWQGFRFSHEDFAYLDSDPSINRVQSNGGYDLYLVET